MSNRSDEDRNHSMAYVEMVRSTSNNNDNNYHHPQQHQTPVKSSFMSNNKSEPSSFNHVTSSLNITQSASNNKTSPVTTTTANMNNINNNKKHNIGFRLRRLFFGSNPNNPSISSKSRTLKDSEPNENKNFIRHNPSLYSSSSESSNEHNKADLRRKRNPITQKKSDNWLQNNNTSLSLSNQNSYECSICLLEQPLFQFPELKTCHHRACINCLRQYLRIEIYESRVNITCLQCQELMHPNDIKAILRNDNVLIEKYESFMVRRTLITDPDARWCPAPDCDYCVIATGCASCPMLRCERPGCETLFCYHCKQEWHPNQTCDQARAQRGFNNRSVFINSPNPAKSNVTFTSRSINSFTRPHTSTSMNSFVQRDEIKPCPCCKVLIIKMNDGSCNHMTCSVCGTEFCWLCMQKISDLHYLSPSGCTFWGKKPWSRKKKIMWQLGMLVGAPVGIALIAGIAVPAIIIGIPVWVGRKLYSRFERNQMSRHKSNFLVTTGVLTSIFVSPILAAVAVGIGVPILLAYVYGVVPISLCRSGGCGVTTSSSGVRIELDEDEITAPDGVSVDTALSGRGVTNPSIGEVSFGMSASLSIGSSSHLDRVVLDIQPDRESSSIAACAGSITSNYVNNGQANTQILGQTKLETLMDNNSSNKRFSLSSQNADSSSVTLSFGERSVNTNLSLIDDASLKAHTRSIFEAPSVNNNVNGNYQQLSFSPVEVHVINDSMEHKNVENSNQCATTKFHSQQPQQYSTKCQTDAVQVHVNLILNKFESRSMEYLSNNYCNICHKSHKPCCPNFQHPNNNKSIKIGNKLQKPVIENKFSTDNDSKQQMTKIIEKQERKQPENNDKIEVMPIQVHLDRHPQEIRNRNSNITTTPTLKKKAVSQIFYPSSYDGSIINSNSNNNNNNYNEEKISKSSLSHSLSFSAYSPLNYD